MIQSALRCGASGPASRGKVRLSAAALIATSPLLAGTAQAQDGDPLFLADARSTITVTATRIPTSILDVPATVSVIDDAAIADNLVSDVKDLVRYEPGVSVRRAPTRFGAAQGSTGRDGNAGFNIRGLEGNRVLIQVDGIRVPDDFSFGAQAVGRGDYTDLSLVKSVEILRGPASALYGSDGLAGAVSFTSSDPADLLNGHGDFTAMARLAYDSEADQFTKTGILAGQSEHGRCSPPIRAATGMNWKTRARTTRPIPPAPKRTHRTPGPTRYSAGSCGRPMGRTVSASRSII